MNTLLSKIAFPNTLLFRRRLNMSSNLINGLVSRNQACIRPVVKFCKQSIAILQYVNCKGIGHDRRRTSSWARPFPQPDCGSPPPSKPTCAWVAQPSGCLNIKDTGKKKLWWLNHLLTELQSEAALLMSVLLTSQVTRNFYPPMSLLWQTQTSFLYFPPPKHFPPDFSRIISS